MHVENPLKLTSIKARIDDTLLSYMFVQIMNILRDSLMYIEKVIREYTQFAITVLLVILSQRTAESVP